MELLKRKIAKLELWEAKFNKLKKIFVCQPLNNLNLVQSSTIIVLNLK